MNKYFIMVVDGEVAGTFPVPLAKIENGEEHPAIEKFRAILSSDPKIIPSDTKIPEGWTWDGENFVEPS